jgi:hypothetical protein
MDLILGSKLTICQRYSVLLQIDSVLCIQRTKIIHDSTLNCSKNQGHFVTFHDLKKKIFIVNCEMLKLFTINHEKAYDSWNSDAISL